MISKEAIELIRLLPMSIKVDILKEELSELYVYEVKTHEILEKNFTTLSNYMEATWSVDDVLDRRLINEFIEKTKKISKILTYFEISEDRKKELYHWAKQRRKELNLSDNIFNIYEGFINKGYKYEKLNEEINKRKSL